MGVDLFAVDDGLVEDRAVDFGDQNDVVEVAEGQLRVYMGLNAIPFLV